MGLMLAIVIGLVTSRFVYNQFQKVAVAKPIATMQVVVASEAMPLSTRLRDDQLKLVPWPTSDPLPGSFTRIEDCVGRALVTAVVPNEAIMQQKLAAREAGAGLPAVIPEGMRALSVRVDDVVGVAGFVVPETMVDVLATGDTATGNGGNTVTRTILEDVRVLAAGQQITQDKEGKPQTVSVVTLLVNPDQADRLTLASNEGRLRLALRNTIDTKQTNPPPVSRATVFFGEPAPKPRIARVAPPPPKPEPYTVEVIKGDKKETLSFQIAQ
jgi:pilus assembly protein CpaB